MSLSYCPEPVPVLVGSVGRARDECIAEAYHDAGKAITALNERITKEQDDHLPGSKGDPMCASVLLYEQDAAYHVIGVFSGAGYEIDDLKQIDPENMYQARTYLVRVRWTS
jgi:hypothetical protein